VACLGFPPRARVWVTAWAPIEVVREPGVAPSPAPGCLRAAPRALLPRSSTLGKSFTCRPLRFGGRLRRASTTLPWL
jgi:hypothetical protein